MGRADGQGSDCRDARRALSVALETYDANERLAGFVRRARLIMDSVRDDLPVEEHSRLDRAVRGLGTLNAVALSQSRLVPRVEVERGGELQTLRSWAQATS